MSSFPPPKEVLYDLYVNKGLSTYKIAEMYGVSYEAVRYWLKKYGIPTRPAPGRVKPKLDPSPELAYVLGVLYGDGTVSKCRWENKKLRKKGYRYVIQLAVTDKVFAEEFMKALEKLGLRPKMYFAPRKPNEKMLGDPTRAKPRWVVTAQSKEFYDFFTSLTIEKLEQIVKNYEQYFIRGFYESEGCVDISPNDYRIRIVNTDRELMEFVKRLLVRLGFNVSFYDQKYEWNGEKRKLYVIQIYGYQQVKKFFELVKPCIRNPFANR